MTKLLEKMMTEVSKLPEAEQEVLAAWILEELTSERRWQQAFAGSPGMLALLASEALTEYHEGRTEPLYPDRL